MSDIRTAKRKAEDLEAVPEAGQDIKKRAKKDEEGEAEGPVEAGGSEDEDEVDPDELEALDSTNVIEGGRRTRGVRVDYTKLKADEDGSDDFDDDDEEDEVEEEGQAADGEVDEEDQANEGNEETAPNGEDKEVNEEDE